MVKIPCPQECQNSHNEHRITMTKIFGKLDNIEEKLDNALIELKTLAECKADKEEVKWLRNVVYGVAVCLLGILGAGIIWLFQYWMEHHV